MPKDRLDGTNASGDEAGPLAAFPRVPLGHAPTPLEHLPRLSAALGGPEIWVKRDDCTGLGMGGNKVRKLEYLMGEVRAQGARTVITVGGVQSNHARQTAAAAARLGLRCELVLPRVVPRSGTDYEHSGNVLLDELFGAEVFVVDDEAEALRMIQERVEAANRRGEPAAVHPPGGSTPIGALGYVRAALECDAQMKAGAPAFERIYVAAGTGGTLAGLLCGFQLAERELSIQGICVAHQAQEDQPAFSALAGEVCDLLGQSRLPDDAIKLTDAFLGEGYGVPSEEGLEAIALCARKEGLLLDPVYTSK
ncbi:MAG: D-cysteine desulfhydrase family protein, partial [Deltaproteobacteria bacterium]|nr:D-cysteine desulfhydrase family protein [Deltaproteobacteria bacterium]